MRAPALVVAIALLGTVAVVLTADPEQPWAVAAFVALVGVAVGAGAVAWQGRARAARRRGREASAGVALRRSVEIGVAVTLLLGLRVLDGLSVITAAFVVATLVVGEAVLSARPQSQR